ncbi:Uncharacterised protein [Acinetobacter baumannii]|nr:Uncharacterised protein [Acinetobacter baumannii]
MISALRPTLRATDAGSRVTFLFAKRKVTKRNAPPAASRRAAHVGALRSSVRRGTARNSLRSDTRASSPSPDLRCSARYKADSTSNATAAPSRSTPRVEALVFALPRNPFAAGTRAMCPGSGGRGLRGCPPHGCGGQAYTDVLAASPANPARPSHHIICSMLPTATRLHMPGHPACRPC